MICVGLMLLHREQKVSRRSFIFTNFWVLVAVKWSWLWDKSEWELDVKEIEIPKCEYFPAKKNVERKRE